MFSNMTVGLLFGLGFAAWVYSKIQQRTGGNTQNSVIVAGVAGLSVFILVTTLLGILL